MRNLVSMGGGFPAFLRLRKKSLKKVKKSIYKGERIGL